MFNTYVALKHFKDADLGLITRRQVLSGLSEEKAVQLKQEGVIRASSMDVSEDKEAAKTALSNDEEIDVIGSPLSQEKAFTSKPSKKNAASERSAQ